ncbi:MAG: isoprenylcysteine carboxylmethyltransferase family protein [Burkholderiaceae bacterium]
MKELELKVPPVVLAIGIAALMWIGSKVLPDFQFSIAGSGFIAIGIAVIGSVIALLGVMAFRSADTTVDPRAPDQSSSLVVHGIYQRTRNPMYVGILLILCAWGLFLGSILSFAMIPVFVVYMNRYQIIPEERYMRANFGEEYAQYVSRVRRWI